MQLGLFCKYRHVHFGVIVNWMIAFKKEKHGPCNASTVTRVCTSLCISFLTSSTDWPEKKRSAMGTTSHPFGAFIILLEVSTSGWGHWWCNCLPFLVCLPPPLSVLLPPLRWNLKAKSGGCWEMNFRKRFHSSTTLAALCLSPVLSAKTNLVSDSWVQSYKLTTALVLIIFALQL